MTLQVLKKTPGEERIFGFDFSTKMVAGATITMVDSIVSENQNQISGSANVTIDLETAGGQKVTARFAGGTDGERYVITGTVQDSNLQTLVLQGWLNVSEETVLVVETGAGLPNANAYMSFMDADELVLQGPYADDWETKEADEKENLILNATKFLDTRFRWYGETLTEEQALQWPRTKNLDDKGRVIPAGVIPQQLKDAVASIAGAFAKDPEALEGVVAGLGTVSSWSTDGLSISFDTKAPEGSQAGMVGAGALLGSRYVNVELHLRSIGTLKDVDWLQGTKKSEVRAWA